ncbi:hypothetical protein HDV62DRAFT_356641 [Trichoderma sp. SZMC 28011]
MEITQNVLSPPPLQEIADVLELALKSNYRSSSSSVVQCPDLRDPPFSLPFEGLNGCESIADIGGQGHLFPTPLLHKKYSLIECAKLMKLPAEGGALLGAGAHHVLGTNMELAPSLSWSGGFNNVNNNTRGARITSTVNNIVKFGCPPSNSTDCTLMMNLYGSLGLAGPVIKITARGRKGDGKSFTEFIRGALKTAYGEDRQISLGGVFIMKQGKALFHVMPEFPGVEDLPFKDTKTLDQWLTYHEYSGPMACLSVLHSSDPNGLGVRLEHTHCFSVDRDEGGHYHYDLPGNPADEDEVVYEGFFNTAKTYFQIDKPKSN